MSDDERPRDDEQALENGGEQAAEPISEPLHDEPARSEPSVRESGPVPRHEGADEGADELERRGRPTFFPSPDDSAGVDALLPSMPPAAPREEVSQVIVLGEPEGPEGGSQEITIPRDVVEERPSTRPGLVSSLLRPSRPPSDEGAATALRNLPRRAATAQGRPWPSAPEEAAHARLTLLEHLTARSEGATRARLLTASADLQSSLGELDRSLALHAQAHAIDPGERLALRELRRGARSDGDLDKLAPLLRAEIEVEPVASERALLWMQLAQVELERDEVELAENAAAQAWEQAPGDRAPGLLLAALRVRAGRKAEAAEALERLARLWPDASGRAAWLVEAVRLLADDGRGGRVRDLAEAASRASPSSIDAALWAYRLARSANDVAAASRALERMERLFDDTRVRAEMVRTRARLAHRLGRDPARALSLLADVTGPIGLCARSRAAEAADAAAEREHALVAWSDQATGAERALVLVELAQLQADLGRKDLAFAAVVAARAADPSLALVAVVREALERRFRISAPVSEAGIDVRDAVARAARLAGMPNEVADEQAWLTRALAAASDPTVEVVLADAAAAAHAWREAGKALARHAERRRAPDAWLAVADLGRAVAETDVDTTEALRSGAACEQGGAEASSRCIHEGLDGAEQAWLDRANALSGEAAAAAATMAGLLADRRGLDARLYYERALGAADYLPAAWGLDRAARDHGDDVALARVQALLAKHSADPLERAARYVRNAELAHARGASATIHADLTNARTLRPIDVTLGALGLDLGLDGTRAEAEHLESVAAAQEGPLSRAYALRAASLFDLAGEPARAVAGLQTRAALAPDDAYVRLGLDAAMSAAGLGAIRVEHLENALKDADAAHRYRALTRLARARTNDDARAVELWQAVLDERSGDRLALRALERAAMNDRDNEALRGVAKRWLRVLEIDADRRGYVAMLLTRRKPVSAFELPDDDAWAHAGDMPDLWLALRLESTAARRGDMQALATAFTAVGARLPEGYERAAYALRAAETIEPVAPEAALEMLRAVTQEDPAHPLALEERGRLEAAYGEPTTAAETYVRAAVAASSPPRKARLLAHAADIWQDRLGDPERALATAREALVLEPAQEEAFGRARDLLERAGDRKALATLLGERLKHMPAPPDRLGLLLQHAQISFDLGDLEGVRASLAHVEQMLGDDVEQLERVARLRLAIEDWRAAAALFVKIARSSKEPVVLHRAFMALGAIYDEHLPDVRRAEVALTRAAVLAPDDAAPLERLASVLHRAGDSERALRVVARWRELAERDPATSEEAMISIAHALGRMNENAHAERLLQSYRRAHPGAVRVLAALGELFREQGAMDAWKVHLDGVIAELRDVVAREPLRQACWEGLILALKERGRDDEAKAVVAEAAKVAANAAASKPDEPDVVVVDDSAETIAVFGGSFDPPHLGHVRIARSILEAGLADRVLVVPAYRHPFDKLLAPYANRVEMCQLAMAKLPQVGVSTLERELGGRSVTARTLEALRERLPNAKLRLVIGSDLLAETDSWHAFDRVREIAPPLVVPRAGHAAPESTELPEQPDFSSTEARERLRDGRSTHDLLDPVIAAYCRSHALYR